MPEPQSRPLSRRVSKTRWDKGLQVIARRRLVPGCNSTTLAVLQRLEHYMSEIGRGFPGIMTLAYDLGRKPQTVAKHLDLAEAVGLLEKNEGGGRGRLTEYFATLPVWLDAQLGGRPARVRARRAPAVRPPLELAAEDPPALAMAAAEPAVERLGAEPPEVAAEVVGDVNADLDQGLVGAHHRDEGDLVSVGQAVREVLEGTLVAPAATSGAVAEPPQSGVAGDVDLAVSETPGEVSAPAAVTSGDAQGLGRKTYPLGRSGREGVSTVPSCLPSNPGERAAGSGGTRQQPRPTRPARVPTSVAQVIAALPLSELQRLQARTWPEAVEAVASGLASSGATPAELARALDQAHQWPLRDAKYAGSALVARMPGALELLATRRRAKARERELGAAPSPPAAPPSAPRGSREVAAAAAAAAHAAIATRPDPKAAPPPASWRRPQPASPPLPVQLARLKARYGAGAPAGDDLVVAAAGA